jgi:hypothetical protein
MALQWQWPTRHFLSGIWATANLTQSKGLTANHRGVCGSLRIRHVQTTDCPSLAFMVQAIINGLMSLEYEQIVLTSSGETILESQVMSTPLTDMWLIFSLCYSCVEPTPW